MVSMCFKGGPSENIHRLKNTSSLKLAHENGEMPLRTEQYFCKNIALYLYEPQCATKGIKLAWE